MLRTRSQARKSLRESCTITAASVRAKNARRASTAHPLGRSPRRIVEPSGDHTSGEDDAISLSLTNSRVVVLAEDVSKMQSL